MNKIESAYKEMMEDVQMSGEMIAYCMKDKALELERELTAARAEIERLDTVGIHSCHDNCQRPNCVLRRELNAVTEQREYWANLWADLARECVKDIAKVEREVVTLTQQRDDWKDKYIQQNKDLGHELRDPNGTIWSECKRLQTELDAVTEQRDGLRSGIDYASDQLHTVTEQRDRLAETLQLFLNRVQYTSVFMDGKLRGRIFDYRSSGFDGEVTQAYEALQSLTPNKL
jgi:DNA repair exonuclease SbcCD ATPase subunit